MVTINVRLPLNCLGNIFSSHLFENAREKWLTLNMHLSLEQRPWVIWKVAAECGMLMPVCAPSGNPLITRPNERSPPKRDLGATHRDEGNLTGRNQEPVPSGPIPPRLFLFLQRNRNKKRRRFHGELLESLGPVENVPERNWIHFRSRNDNVNVILTDDMRGNDSLKNRNTKCKNKVFKWFSIPKNSFHENAIRKKENV